MSQGLFGDDEKEENEAASEDEEDDGGTAQPVRAENRKTRKQRNKEKVLKEEVSREGISSHAGNVYARTRFHTNLERFYLRSNESCFESGIIRSHK